MRLARPPPDDVSAANTTNLEETTMTAIDLTIHGTGTGTCSLTGKEGEGMTVSFKDGTVKEAFLCTKAFMQLLRLKAGQPQEKRAHLAAPVNGQPATQH